MHIQYDQQSMPLFSSHHPGSPSFNSFRLNCEQALGAVLDLFEVSPNDSHSTPLTDNDDCDGRGDGGEKF